MTTFLDQMAASSAKRARAIVPTAASSVPPRPLPAGFILIAEIKRRSPAAGDLNLAADPLAQAAAYVRGGAAAISVLTEPDHFGGHIDDLCAVATQVPAPAMRKDFLVHPTQVAEARAAGASGVLLIVRMLDDEPLTGMIGACAARGMWTLLEAFDERDLDRVAAIISSRAESPHKQPELLVGVNSRDLHTLLVDPDRLARLAPKLPTGVRAIAESGIQTPADIAHAVSLGYHGALVGSALMQAADPAALCAQLLAAAQPNAPATQGHNS